MIKIERQLLHKPITEKERAERGMEPKKGTITELIETLSRFTPEQLELFQSAAQRLIRQTLVQVDLSKSE